MFNTMFWNDIEQSLESFRRSFEGFCSPSGADGTEWVFTPSVETGRTKDRLNLRVILPGVTEKDVNVTIRGNQLWIRGERKAPEYVEKNGVCYSGLIYGKFESVVDLPAGLDLDKMEAYLHEGVLDIQIPLSAAMKPKQIPVSSGEPHQALAA